MLKLLAGLTSSLFAAKTGPIKETKPAEVEGRRKRKRQDDAELFTSYYGRPVIKKPHWIWPIWFYFWVGGISGGASAITALTELFGDKERDHSIIRAGRYISIGGLMISPVLLIIDLQRPERFHHMLRILKWRSPLSVGTYILTSTGILSGLNAARQVVEDGFIPKDSLPGKLTLLASNPVTSTLQGIDGMALGTYTGVLLSATAVPLWAENDTTLAPLFLSSAFSTGAAAITLARTLGGTPTKELHRLEPIERNAIFSELALTTYGFWKLPPEVRKHVTSGIHAWLFAGAVGLGQVGPLLLQLLAPKEGKAGRGMALLNSVMVLTGGFLLRVAVVTAGRASADDSAAYHATTRGPGRASPEEQAAKAAHPSESANDSYRSLGLNL